MENEDFKLLVENAIDKLEAQGIISYDPSTDTCKYTMTLSSTELCCIVGHMMPSKQIRREADVSGYSSGINILYNKKFPWAQQFTKEQILLLSSLQDWHDKSKLPFPTVIRKMRKELGKAISTMNPIVWEEGELI